MGNKQNRCKDCNRPSHGMRCAECRKDYNEAKKRQCLRCSAVLHRETKGGLCFRHRNYKNGNDVPAVCPTENYREDVDELEFVKALKRGTTPELLSIRFEISLDDVRGLIGKLKRKGFSIDEYGDTVSIGRTPAPQSIDDIRQFQSDDDGHHRFGACGDSHLGSKYAREDVLDELYDWYQAHGVRHVFQCGNWIDGEARFNKPDLIGRAHGMQNQLDYFVERYPQRPGITTYYVAGDDHEGWYTRSGVDIGRMAEQTARDAGRTDLVYLGYMEAYVDLVNSNTGNAAKMLVAHPGGGSSYAISYTTQKAVESYQGGEKPAILLFGHYHKIAFNLMRNVWCIQVGCQEDQTPFMRKKRLSAHIGGVLVDCWQDERGAVNECMPRFKQWFDRGYHNNQWRPTGHEVIRA